MAEPPVAPTFDVAGLVRSLLADARHAALGTLSDDGKPHVTLVALARDADGVPLIITSHLSAHTGHLERNPEVSLLIADLGKGDPLAHPRMSLAAKAEAVRPGDVRFQEVRSLYLEQNPKAALYVDLPGFWFWRLMPATVALNGGFGKAWNGAWAEVGIG